MTRLATGVVVLAAVFATGAESASPLLPAQKRALAGIQASAARGQLDAATAAKDRTLVNRAAAQVRSLPAPRAAAMSAQLAQVAALAERLSTPRALVLFGQLQANEQWFRDSAPPHVKTDITDADGVVYRFFPHRGFEFHPLANFAALNELVAAQDTTHVRALADALVARAIAQPRGGLAWEYEFDFADGHAPWLSGMAQAVAAQALARASTLLADPALMAAARGAFRTIPGRLVQHLLAGPWIKLYAFNKDVVLNAQLQSVLSLADYADATDDAAASRLAAALEQTALRELPRFDTGYWSYYALPHVVSPLDYQQYVVELLQKLAAKNPAFADTATRFDGYVTQPPAFRLADAGPGALKLWLSKPASVVVTAAGPAKRLPLSYGWHTIDWKLPAAAGIWPVEVTATDWAGNRASVEALPLVHVAHAASRTTAALTPVAAGQPSFTVGAALDDPTQAPLAARARLDAVKVAVTWSAGQTVPDPALVATLTRLASNYRLVVELRPDVLPGDDPGRTALAAFVTSLLQQVPDVGDVWLGPPPAAPGMASYVSALGAVYDAAKALSASAEVGGELDGAASPQTVLNVLARVYKTSGRAKPFADELAFRPAAAPATGVWSVSDYAKLTATLGTAFAGTPQPAGLPILYDGVATAPRADQAAALTELLRTTACEPQIAGAILGRLVDTSTDTSGLYTVDGTAKASVAELKTVFANARRGSLAVCPHLAVPAAPSSLLFPVDLTTSVQLGCFRDCLYLVTLEQADGKPVRATRGALNGGAAASTIPLPSAPVPPGSYTYAVRIVNQANPGPVQLFRSLPFSVG